MRFFHIALQPTTFCNMNCRYCYLPLRQQRSKMPVQIAKAIADSLSIVGKPVRIVWHAGEPLACGIDHFQKLITCFAGKDLNSLVSHSLQTNATLIDANWCDLFKEFGVEIGVSIDGPDFMSEDRVDWSGRKVTQRIERGLQHLRNAGIPFTIIAVVGKKSLMHASNLYRYALDSKCWMLAINIEETEGPHRADELAPDAVKHFWTELFGAWRREPVIPIREFSRLLYLMRGCVRNNPPVSFGTPEIFPSVGTDGSVVLLSPELVNNAPHLVIGNVNDEPLHSMLARAPSISYVHDYLAGLTMCERTCGYFSLCGGGAASNRYFEKGRMDVTETSCCKNRTQLCIDGILDDLRRAQ